jgi:hypothetical protein
MSPHPGSATTPQAHPVQGVPVSFRGRPEADHREETGRFTIDCAECSNQDTEVCDDCVVSFIVGHRPGDAVVVDAGEARAVRLLERAGLVPGVRHRRRAS